MYIHVTIKYCHTNLVAKPQVHVTIGLPLLLRCEKERFANDIYFYNCNPLQNKVCPTAKVGFSVLLRVWERRERERERETI